MADNYEVAEPVNTDSNCGHQVQISSTCRLFKLPKLTRLTPSRYLHLNDSLDPSTSLFVIVFQIFGLTGTGERRAHGAGSKRGPGLLTEANRNNDDEKTWRKLRNKETHGDPFSLFKGGLLFHEYGFGSKNL